MAQASSQPQSVNEKSYILDARKNFEDVSNFIFLNNYNISLF